MPTTERTQKSDVKEKLGQSILSKCHRAIPKFISRLNNAKPVNSMSAISIPKGPIELAALLHKPVSKSAEVQAIIVVHPGGGVKEQATGTYARKLAENGFTTIVYDASYQGESGGEPHFLEDPAARVSDVWAVVDYLEKLYKSSPLRIGILGICAGGGYAVAAAKADYRLRAVATVSLVNIGDSARLGWNGDEGPTRHVESLKQAAAQISAESRGAAPGFAPYVPVQPGAHTPDDLRDGSDYYMRRGYHPRGTNKMLIRSFPRVLTFDAFHLADLFLKQPTLLVAGENAGSLWHTQRLDKIIGGADRKRLVPGAAHMSFYDDDKFVDLAVEEVSEFMKTRLI